jgi:hypothetical protein
MDAGGPGSKDGQFDVIHKFETRDGPYKGQDPLVLYRQGIQFWKDYLDHIDGADGSMTIEV